MSNTIFTTINFAQALINYAPLTYGIGSEPAITIASMIRNSFLNSPLSWSWNRFEDSSTTITSANTDYTVNLTNFGWLERVVLTDGSGNTQEIKEIYNTLSLAKNKVSQRPSAVSVLINTPGTSVKIRFNSTPDQSYTATLIYQGLATQFGPFVINSSANAAGGNTAYTGIFTPASFPTGSTATIAGFTTNAVNNGTFLVVSCTSTILTVANASGIAETPANATAINGSWAPIPDQYSDVYTSLFLSEAFQSVGYDAEAARYRQRGVAAMLAKAEGLTQAQISAWTLQWLQRDTMAQASQLRTAQGNQARGI